MTLPDAGSAAFQTLDAAALLAALPDPVAHLGADGQVTLNRAAQARVAQYSATGDWMALFQASSVPAIRDAVQAALGGETRQVTVQVVDTAAPGLLTVAPSAGGALLHLHVARDPLEVALELMDGLGLGMTVQAPDTRILLANDAAARILGMTREQLLGRDSMDPEWRAVHPDGTDFPGETHPSVQALRTLQVQREVPMGVYHPQAQDWRWLQVTAIPRRAPGATQPKQVTTVFADVTEKQAMQTEMRRRERRYRSLVRATSQIVWDAFPDGDFQPPQADWEAFTGQTPAQYRGVGWLDAIHPDDRAHTIAEWQRAVRDGDLYSVEHRLRRADGQYVPMQVRAVPVTEERGQLVEWVGTHSDLSAIREAEQALRALNAELEGRVQQRTEDLARVTRFSTLLLTAAGEGIFGLDGRGVTTFANPAAARMLGYSIERMIGQPQHDLVHHHHEDGRPYPLAECPIHQTLRDGQTRRVERDVMWHAQGHAVPVAYVVTPTHDEDGQPSGAVVMVQDITERVRAQEQLQELIEDLERSNQDLEQFAYVASHDLQEPLRTVGSYTELLARRYQGQLDPRADQYLHFMQDAVDRMRSLIQDLLGFARLSRADLTLTPVALDTLLRGVQQNVRGTLDADGSSLAWDTPDQVMGQASLLTQLLTNLVSNGLKFHRPGEAAHVQVTSRREGDMIHVQVRDNGIGIAPEYHARIFEIFQRLHRRETYAGNGMGLAICRKITEHHGGRIWLDSTPDQGSTFHLTLPAVPS
ncbi:PAS/PAC sensor signal transduction histidine kinase [Deinococcus grandis]|uniref:histidine kinase n=1 Tax=Deinococcus grandis TaxID=57498 RepID=A0A117DRF4_9DEIO|nr:PAS domain S-box protein [Deinococcus grandis]BBN93405.1 PAS domain-containing sensor histidine kinase [Deinococcus grandis]GAQ23084.1 PAS/PAC sensor signal transduction histidine kinase [Deinococcus grandis]